MKLIFDESQALKAPIYHRDTAHKGQVINNFKHRLTDAHKLQWV